MKLSDLAPRLDAFLNEAQTEVPAVYNLRLYKRERDILLQRFEGLINDSSGQTKERLIGFVEYIAACKCQVAEVGAYVEHLIKGTNSEKVLDIMTDLFSSLDELERGFPHVMLRQLSKELKDVSDNFASEDVFDREVNNFLKRLGLVIHNINELHFDIEQDLHLSTSRSVSDEGLPPTHTVESTHTAPIAVLRRLIEPFSLVEKDIVENVRSQLNVRSNLLIKYLLREYKQDIACQLVPEGGHLSDFVVPR